MRYASMPGHWGLASAGAFVFARIVRSVRTMHARQPIHLIHAHAPLPCGHAAFLLGRELGIPFVVSVHGLDAYSTEQRNDAAARWCRRMSTRVYAGAKRVICISEQVRRRVLQDGQRSYATSVVYNGVDPEIFSPPKAVSNQRPKIASVGNLIPIKGHELLLRAIAALRERHPEVCCEIVGSGSEQDHLQRLAAELGIASRIKFLGRRSRHQVAELLQSATLFALPSRYEGLGCVYLEAMSAGLVAIGCREQGIEEVILHRRNGWLVGPDDLDELTSGLDALLRSSQLREQIGGRARLTILQGFTLNHQAGRVLQIYRECVQ
jgi:glycosyltransferase involved in cell wall biosynthesis